MVEVHDKGDLTYGILPHLAAEIEEAGLLGLVERCDFLYQQAFYANAELAILFDLKKAPGEYEREVICAPCFFTCVGIALADACFMNCARLFDGGGNVTVGTFLEMCASMTGEIDSRACEVYRDRPDFDDKKPIRHPLTPDEERFYPQQDVKLQRCDDQLFGGGHCEPVFVNMTASDLVELWQKRYSGLGKLIERLRRQRNKVFAHNDAATLDYESFVSKCPLTFGEMQRLIDFALGITIETVAIVVGDNRPRLPRNIGDLRGLLNYVDVGMEAVEQQAEDLRAGRLAMGDL